ncbi:MAG: helix-turn-helix domain-containing protein [Azospirillum sp.]|nr:helix-turn-helix domain-containing protein [Azospirillum sp.]
MNADQVTITPAQLRAGRAFLGWSQTKLAKAAAVSLSTVRDFEKGRTSPIRTTLLAMRTALEAAGIEFQGTDSIRLRSPAPDAGNDKSSGGASPT